MTALQLTPQLHVLFGGLLEQACGAHYAPDDRGLFEAKLAAHVADAGYDDLLDYYYRLRYDDPDGSQLRDLVRSMVVHETYFFRELAPLRQLVDGHLAGVIAARGHARVWSAACATGEEPLTLAMVLDSAGLLDRVEIIATDISTAAIDRARSGRHLRQALRAGHPEELAARYLRTTPDGIAVAPEIHAAVSFGTANLVDPASFIGLGTFDAILCRNVLIYFRDEGIVRLVEQLARMLTPGGLLAVGVSESLLRHGSALICEERGGAFFYRCPR